MKISARQCWWKKQIWWYRACPVIAGLAVVFACGRSAGGQVPEQPPKPGEGASPTARTDPNDPMRWNVDAMMEEAVQQIARRYNLNKAQEEYTRLLLTRRTKEFLKQHEDEVRKLLKENIDFRIGLKSATKEALMNWAQRAVPVFDSAKSAILEGNNEWRQILTEEQKKTHDSDLAQMDANFNNLEGALKGWQQGTGPAIGPIQRTSAPAGNAEPTTGLVSQNPASRSILLEENWKGYVDKFIQVYKLDEKQQNSALAGIHKETLSQAKQYREKHQGDFESVGSQLAAVAKDPKASERRETLQRQKNKLEEPLRSMFVYMDNRLKTLPHDDQRAGADPAQVQVLKAMYDELSGARLKDAAAGGVKGRTETQPASSQPGAATQPAATQPASQPTVVKPPTIVRPASQPVEVSPATSASPPQAKPTSPPATPVTKPPAAPTGGKPKIPDPPKGGEGGKQG